MKRPVTTPQDITRALRLAELGEAQSVTYWPIRSRTGELGGRPVHTTTASRPWVLGHGGIVVRIHDGPRGGVAIEHLRLDGEDV